MKKELAIQGGPAVTNTPFPQWPSFDLEVTSEITEILKTGKVNYWTGNRGKGFEESLQSYLGSGHTITTTNGTSALHTAISALGIGAGDEVICPAYTFIATAFSVMQAGALPVFADIDASHTLDPDSIKVQINERTKAIIVVHTYGVVADMDAILAIAKEHNLFVIEDCAQALGGEFNGKKVGTVSDAGCFSFCQSKHFTTGGEGGAIYVNNEDVMWKCRSFRDHGFDVEKRIELLELEEKLAYIHPRVGFNYRMTEIQSAIGVKELARFDDWNLANRVRNGRFLSSQLSEHPGVKAAPIDNELRKNAFWWAPFTLDMAKLTCDIKTFVEALNAEGVPALTVPWPEIYHEEVFQKQQGAGTLNYPFSDSSHRDIDYTAFFCKNAHELGLSTVIFPTHPVYELTHMTLCVEAFIKVYEHYKG